MNALTLRSRLPLQLERRTMSFELRCVIWYAAGTLRCRYCADASEDCPSRQMPQHTSRVPVGRYTEDILVKGEVTTDQFITTEISGIKQNTDVHKKCQKGKPGEFKWRNIFNVGAPSPIFKSFGIGVWHQCNTLNCNMQHVNVARSLPNQGQSLLAEVSSVERKHDLGERGDRRGRVTVVRVVPASVRLESRCALRAAAHIFCGFGGACASACVDVRPAASRCFALLSQGRTQQTCRL